MARVKKSDHKVTGDGKTYDELELICILKEEMQSVAEIQNLYNQQLILEGRNAFEELTTIRNRIRNLKSYMSTQQFRDVNKVKQFIEECERALSKFRCELKKSTQSLIHDEVALWQECSVFDEKIKAWKQGPDPAKSKQSVSNASIAVISDMNLPSQVFTYQKIDVAPPAASSGAASTPKKLADQDSALVDYRERQKAKVEAWRANKRRELEEKREAELAMQRARYQAEDEKRQARMNALRAKMEDFVKRREQIVASRSEYRAVHERAGRAARRELCALISARIQERNERIFRTRSAKRSSQKTDESDRQQKLEHTQSMLIMPPSRDPSHLLCPPKNWKARVEGTSLGVNVTGVTLSALSCRRAIPPWRGGLGS